MLDVGFGAGAFEVGSVVFVDCSVRFTDCAAGFVEISSSESSLNPAPASIALTLLLGVSSIGDRDACMAGVDAAEETRLECAGVEGADIVTDSVRVYGSVKV